MRSATSGPIVLAAVLWATLPACSGGGAESGEPAKAAGAGQGSGAASPAPAPSPEQKLRAAQESAVQAMCERLVECAVKEARATMSPDEVAQLELEKTAPRLRDECEDEGARTQLSPRQVTVVQRCVNDAATCDALQTCLNEAKKQPQ